METIYYQTSKGVCLDNCKYQYNKMIGSIKCDECEWQETNERDEEGYRYVVCFYKEKHPSVDEIIEF